MNTKKVKQNKSFACLDDIYQCFQEYDSEMLVQTMRTFLNVAMASESISMQKLVVNLNMPQSTLSRNVATLSAINRHREKGHELVESFEDPTDRRNKLVKLTYKGERLAERIHPKLNSCIH
jgi:DNA-binding MarR family transcriptional regulator